MLGTKQRCHKGGIVKTYTCPSLHCGIGIRNIAGCHCFCLLFVVSNIFYYIVVNLLYIVQIVCRVIRQCLPLFDCFGVFGKPDILVGIKIWLKFIFQGNIKALRKDQCIFIIGDIFVEVCLISAVASG